MTGNSRVTHWQRDHYTDSTHSMAEAPFMLTPPTIDDGSTHESRLPDGLAAFSWVGSTGELELRDKAWVPQKLAPWKYQKRLEPSTSVGLSRNGITVGWLLTSRIAPVAIGYESLFVHPSVRPLGGARFLLAEGIRRQAAAFGPASHGIFTVATENRSMIRLINRHLRQHLISETELIVLSKVLASDCGYG